MGLNSGLGDVHNLAYKLAAVHHGWAGDGLLDTYQSERRQVALVNSAQSVKNGKQIFSLLKALGTTDQDVDVARENLYRNLQDPGAMVEINRGIEGQREHFDNLGLHIGYVYGDTEIPQSVSRFQSSCAPGSRLPHAWIKLLSRSMQLPPIDCSYVQEFSAEQVSGKQFSSLDLCRLDAFTLIVDARNSQHLQSMVTETFKHLPGHIAQVLPLHTVVYGVDFVVQDEAGSWEWLQLTNLKEQSILVRPDQHILGVLHRGSGNGELLQLLKDHLAF